MKILLAKVKHPGNSVEFIKYAIDMAQSFNFNLHLLHVQYQSPETHHTHVGDSNSPLLTKDLTDKMMVQNTLDELQKNTKQILTEKNVDIAVDYSAEMGPDSMVLNSFIEEKNIEMILLDDDDNSILSLSSSHMKIVKLAKCPVWIIPSNLPFKHFQKIVYATDYQEADVHNLKKLISLFSGFSPQIIALHITDSLEFEERVLRKGFKDTLEKETDFEKLSIRLLKDKNDHPEDSIDEFAKEINADLIVLLKENRGFFERIFKPSSTQRMLNKTNLPVLIFQEDINDD